MLRMALKEDCTKAVQCDAMSLIFAVQLTGEAAVCIVTLGLWLEALGRLLVFKEKEMP